eukprot:GEMP01011547.1.p1 GENE.GEMP01011547.1~~GEMP01011547.1.p1  ORF type:complete len:595 (+),score=162.66 GEMP01011547.1:299-2083(+)
MSSQQKRSSGGKNREPFTPSPPYGSDGSSAGFGNTTGPFPALGAAFSAANVPFPTSTGPHGAASGRPHRFPPSSSGAEECRIRVLTLLLEQQRHGYEQRLQEKQLLCNQLIDQQRNVHREANSRIASKQNEVESLQRDARKLKEEQNSQRAEWQADRQKLDECRKDKETLARTLAQLECQQAIEREEFHRASETLENVSAELEQAQKEREETLLDLDGAQKYAQEMELRFDRINQLCAPPPKPLTPRAVTPTKFSRTNSTSGSGKTSRSLTPVRSSPMALDSTRVSAMPGSACRLDDTLTPARLPASPFDGTRRRPLTRTSTDPSLPSIDSLSQPCHAAPQQQPPHFPYANTPVHHVDQQQLEQHQHQHEQQQQQLYQHQHQQEQQQYLQQQQQVQQQQQQQKEHQYQQQQLQQQQQQRQQQRQQQLQQEQLQYQQLQQQQEQHQKQQQQQHQHHSPSARVGYHRHRSPRRASSSKMLRVSHANTNRADSNAMSCSPAGSSREFGMTSSSGHSLPQVAVGAAPFMLPHQSFVAPLLYSPDMSNAAPQCSFGPRIFSSDNGNDATVMATEVSPLPSPPRDSGGDGDAMMVDEEDF